MCSLDLKDLLRLKNESWFGTHTIAILNIDEQARWYESMLNSNKHIVMIAEEKEKNFGGVPLKIGVYKISNIDWMNQKYDSAYDVFENARGNGFGKKVLEAGVDFGFEILNMHRSDTEVLVNNIASQKCIKFGGFTEEGVKRSCIRKCDEWLDSIVYGLLRDDWRQLKRVKNYNGICNVSYKPKDG